MEDEEDDDPEDGDVEFHAARDLAPGFANRQSTLRKALVVRQFTYIYKGTGWGLLLRTLLR